MSPEELEAFSRGVQAYNRRDVEGVLEVLGPDIEWHDVFQVMLGGSATTVRGHEGVRGLMGDQAEVFDEFETEYSEIRDLGDRLLAIGVIRVRGKESGVEVESPVGVVVDFESGKAVRVSTFLDRGDAVDAAGVSE